MKWARLKGEQVPIGSNKQSEIGIRASTAPVRSVKEVTHSPQSGVCSICRLPACATCIVFDDLGDVWANGDEPDLLDPWEEVTDRDIVLVTPEKGQK